MNSPRRSRRSYIGLPAEANGKLRRPFGIAGSHADAREAAGRIQWAFHLKEGGARSSGSMARSPPSMRVRTRAIGLKICAAVQVEQVHLIQIEQKSSCFANFGIIGGGHPCDEPMRSARGVEQRFVPERLGDVD